MVIDGTDVSQAIRTPEIDAAAATVARHPAVRRVLVARQRDMGRAGGVVMEGRDIGTVVFPDADVKIYLDASPEERARRRASDPAHAAPRVAVAGGGRDRAGRARPQRLDPRGIAAGHGVRRHPIETTGVADRSRRRARHGDRRDRRRGRSGRGTPSQETAGLGPAASTRAHPARDIRVSRRRPCAVCTARRPVALAARPDALPRVRRSAAQKARRAVLAAVARPADERRVGDRAAADRVERIEEHPLEGRDSRSRFRVADRLGRPRLRADRRAGGEGRRRPARAARRTAGSRRAPLRW